MNSDKTPALLRAIAKFIERLSDSDREALATGQATLELGGTLKAKTRGASRLKTAGVDPQHVIDSLHDVRTREEALGILERDGVTKVVLEKIARRFDLPVLRSDSTDKIRAKIVEFSVGFRLNSGAVQGSKDREGGGEPNS